MLALTFAGALVLGGFSTTGQALRMDAVDHVHDHLAPQNVYHDGIDRGIPGMYRTTSAASTMANFVLQREPCIVAGQMSYQDMALKFQLNSTGFSLSDAHDSSFSLDHTYGDGVGALDVSRIMSSKHKHAIVELMVALILEGATADQYPCTFNVLALGKHLIKHSTITDRQTLREVDKAYLGVRKTAPNVGLPQCGPGNTTANEEPYEFCTNRCFGMCGVACNCIPICGDCNCHAGCEEHDAYCAVQQPCGWLKEVHDCASIFMVLNHGGCEKCTHCQAE